MSQKRFPAWITKSIRANDGVEAMKRVLLERSVSTVCEGALCPNLNECYSENKTTFMILGDRCTRRCAFCSVKKGDPGPEDKSEAVNIAEVVKSLRLKYITITSVTRDDMPDGGAGCYAKVIRQVKSIASDIKVEVLIPDFGGKPISIQTVLDAGPDVVAHNLETVERLYPTVRQGANYTRSLNVLRAVKSVNIRRLTKSGIMLGLGENDDEVNLAMRDLVDAGCDVLVLGQYLRPKPENIPVTRFVRPDDFERFRESGEAMGFKRVVSGPFMRSSYRAEEVYKSISGQGCNWGLPA